MKKQKIVKLALVSWTIETIIVFMIYRLTNPLIGISAMLITILIWYQIFIYVLSDKKKIKELKING